MLEHSIAGKHHPKYVHALTFVFVRGRVVSKTVLVVCTSDERMLTKVGQMLNNINITELLLHDVCIK